VLFIKADQTGESSGGPRSDAGHLHVTDKPSPHTTSRRLSPFRPDL